MEEQAETYVPGEPDEIYLLEVDPEEELYEDTPIRADRTTIVSPVPDMLHGMLYMDYLIDLEGGYHFRLFTPLEGEWIYVDFGRFPNLQDWDDNTFIQQQPGLYEELQEEEIMGLVFDAREVGLSVNKRYKYLIRVPQEGHEDDEFTPGIWVLQDDNLGLLEGIKLLACKYGVDYRDYVKRVFDTVGGVELELDEAVC